MNATRVPEDRTRVAHSGTRVPKSATGVPGVPTREPMRKKRSCLRPESGGSREIWILTARHDLARNVLRNAAIKNRARKTVKRELQEKIDWERHGLTRSAHHRFAQGSKDARKRNRPAVGRPLRTVHTHEELAAKRHAAEFHLQDFAP
jgi:hypothetical protein